VLEAQRAACFDFTLALQIPDVIHVKFTNYCYFTP